MKVAKNTSQAWNMKYWAVVAASTWVGLVQGFLMEGCFKGCFRVLRVLKVLRMWMGVGMLSERVGKRQ